MVSLWKVVLLGLLVTSCSSTKEHSGQVLDYVTSLIQYLADQNPGSFDCWFYQTSVQTSNEPILDAIVSSDRLSLIPKRILFAEGMIEVRRSPRVLVMEVDGNRFALMHLFLTSSFDRGIKIIVLYNHNNREGLTKSKKILRTLQLHDVVYICKNILEIHNIEAFQTQTFQRNGAIPFQEVFRDPTSNLTGRTFHLSQSEKILWNSDSINGYPTKLFEAIIKRLGGQVQFHLYNCNSNQSLMDCSMKSWFYNSTTMYDFGTNIQSNTKIVNEHFMHSLVPITIQIAAPSGQKLTLLNVFLMPFRPGLWILLLAAIMVSILIMAILPQRFKNNLILLPLCGFEKSKFHQVSSVEKTILTVLIVIYFVLLTAYDAKISAFLTDYPYAPDPRTLDDLLESGLKIEQMGESFENSMMEEDPRMRNLFAKKEAGEWCKLDWTTRKFAYTGSRSHLFSMMHDPENFDPETGRRRMIVLDQFNFGNRNGFFITSYRNPLVPKLQRAEFNLFEGGFTDLWLQQITRQLYGARHVGIVSNGYNFVHENIGVSAMDPALYVIAFGWTLGIIIFFAEICLNMLKKCTGVR